MPPSSLPSAQAYYDLYKGKTLLVKASGALLHGESLQQICHDIQTLIRHDINIILVFGGGHQTDKEWHKHHTEHRPKRDGCGITNHAVLQDAVLPAFAALQNTLRRMLPQLTIAEPSALQCTQDTSKGLVGIPTHIELPKQHNVAIGFVGEADGQSVNVNADEIVTQLVKQLGHDLNEVVMLTKTGGIQHNEKIVPIIVSDHIRNNGTHDSIPVSGGMQQKLKSIREMLPHVGKIAITDSLQKEIETWRGSGTLCIDTTMLECTPLQPYERQIVTSVYEEYVQQRIFRAREVDSLNRTLDHHRVLRCKNSLLGGFSLIEQEQGWTELSFLWSAYIGNGIGSALAKEWKKLWQQTDSPWLYALSTPKDEHDIEQHSKTIRRFTNFGMQCLGSLRSVQKEYQKSLPLSLRQYDTEKRNPYVFVYGHRDA